MTLTTTNMGLLQAQGTDNARDYLKTYLANSLTSIDTHDHSSTKGVPVKRLANGTFASRPAAGNAGHAYIATDSNRVSWDNGTSWIEAVINATTQAISLGGGLTVTAGGIVVSGGGLSVDAGSGSTVFLSFPHTGSGGGNAASAGDIRFLNNKSIAWRNSNGTGDDTLVFDATDTFVIGGAGLKTAGQATFQGIASVDAGAGTGAYLMFPHSGAGLGSPAAGGDIRFLNNKAISWRNAAGTADIAMYVDTNNQLHLDGMAPVATAGAVTGDLVINIAGTQYRIALKQ